MIALLRRLAWRVIGAPVARRRLPDDVFRSWNFEYDGHVLNGLNRLTGDDASYASVKCEHPECERSIQEIAHVDKGLVLVCRNHFTPKGVVAAYESRKKVA